MTARVGLKGLTPSGFQRATIDTATSLNSTVRDSHVLQVSVETQDARYRADGSAPTATTGVLLQAGVDHPFVFWGFNGTSDLKFISATAGSVINVQGYKYGGE